VTSQAQVVGSTVVRTFRLLPYPEATMEVQTVAGFPAAALTDTCGYEDAQPSTEAKVGSRLCADAVV
jgi:hypothetical protein